MKARDVLPTDRPWIEAQVAAEFGSPRVVSRGVVHDALSLPGLVAERGGCPMGLLLFRIDRGECEVVVLIAARRRECVGPIRDEIEFEQILDPPEGSTEARP